MRSRRSAFLLAAALGLLAATDRFDSAPWRPAALGTEPEGADVWFLAQRAAPDGTIHPEARTAALASLRRLRAEGLANGRAVAQQTSWVPVGPTNTGGRITDIAVNASNDAIALVATASGGVWKTTDAGATWRPVFDGSGVPAVGAISGSSAQPQVVYLGTGEANPGGGSLAFDGDGVWKSTDGGESWAHVGLDSTGSIGRIAVDPANPDRVFAAAMGTLFSPNPWRGLYRSLDGGGSWTRVLVSTDSTGCIDVAVDPANPNRVYAALWERTRRAHTRNYGGTTSGIWRSTDGGNTWTQLTTGLPAPPVGRIGIAIAASAPQTLYAVYSDPPGNFAGVFRSNDGGDHWTRCADDLLVGDSPFAWWFGRVWVDPANSARVWVAGLSLYRSLDGGASWAMVDGLHADHHAMWIEPGNGRVWEGNDGGIYRSTDGGTAWTKATGLAITQIYHLNGVSSDPGRLFAGAQDSGVHRTSGDPASWQLVRGGDGQYVMIDPASPQVVYAEIQYGSFTRSVANGDPGTFFSATSGISPTDRKNWTTPVVLDPQSPPYPGTRLYYGANRLYRSMNAASSWTAVSPDLTDGAQGSGGVVFGTLTTVAVAPTDTATIYAGTDDGNVWVSRDYAATWQKVGTELPKRWVTRLVVDPGDAAVAYATFSGLRWNEPLAHVFRTIDFGATWTDVSGDLPDVPVNALAVDPRDRKVVYVGTDIGVFASVTRGGAWVPLDAGMPVGTIVTDLDLVGGSSPRLLAGTYGRSAYALDLGAQVLGVSAADPGRNLLSLRCRPEPWRDRLSVSFVLPWAGPVTVDVLDVMGRRVARISESLLPAGPHELTIASGGGADLAPGSYVVRVRSSDLAATTRITRLR